MLTCVQMNGIHVEVLAGANVYSAIYDAIRLADEFDSPVFFEFNGTPMRVVKDSNAYELLSQYCKNRAT